jgi:hypothetical protein
MSGYIKGDRLPPIDMPLIDEIKYAAWFMMGEATAGANVGRRLAELALQVSDCRVGDGVLPGPEERHELRGRAALCELQVVLHPERVQNSGLLEKLDAIILTQGCPQ